jgi:hypothetical protein
VFTHKSAKQQKREEEDDKERNENEILIILRLEINKKERRRRRRRMNHITSIQGYNSLEHVIMGGIIHQTQFLSRERREEEYNHKIDKKYYIGKMLKWRK